MAGNHLLSITSISDYFKNNIKQLKRGEIAYKDNHVLKFQMDPNLGIIVGEVKPSMRSDPYKVEILINDDRITNSKCSCPRGTAICHHIAALAIYTHYNLSSTDKSCSWSARKNNLSTEIKTINQIYGSIDFQDTIVSETDIKIFIEEIYNLAEPVGFSWLLQPEPEPSENNIALVETIGVIILDPEIRRLVRMKNFISLKKLLFTKLHINDSTILQLVKDTTGQQKNPLWFHYRQHRLTASNFGIVLAACKRNKFPKSLFKKLKNNNITGVHAVQWGITNEICGIKVLEQDQNVNVKPTGLWLKTSGLLGATPDGLVNSSHIVEVKCPWKYWNAVLEVEITKNHDYILYKENNELFVNKTHPYWDQIQGQLYLTNRQFCYLVIWTPKQALITEIEKDVKWIENLEILETFFIEKYIPYLVDI